MSYSLKSEEERLERDSIQRGIDRYMEAHDREEEKGREFDTPVAERMLKRTVQAIVPHIRALQAKGHHEFTTGLSKGGRPSEWAMRINLLSAEALAFITVKSIVVAGRDGHRAQRVCGAIGRMAQMEYWWSEARRKEAQNARERDHQPPNRIELLKRTVKEVNPKAVKQWMKRLDDLGIEQWPTRECIHLGAACLEVALPFMSELVECKDVRRVAGRGYAQEKELRLKPEFTEALREAHTEVAMMRPWLMPMVIPPVPWEQSGGTMSGGYRILDSKFIRGDSYQHTAVDDVPQKVVDALNRIQETPWVINTFVLEIAQDCFRHDLGPVPYEPPMGMPERLTDEEWEALSRSGKGEAKAARARVHDHNNREAAKKLGLARALTVAERFADYQAIYFPHAIDWRGRAYPIPQDLHPQGPDMVRALLLFADAKRLGERGYEWLCQHLASCYGLDKVDRLSQQLWVESNRARLIEVGQDPWLHAEFWQEAEEPWQFLAAAHEFSMAHAYENPADYHSRLVVSVDGSCNGLQHLSAMGLDPVGAAAVNLRKGARNDIYQIVADKVNARIEPGNPWEGKVTRKTVKRAVMTTPYGVTRRGIADQLKKDGFTRDLEGDPLANANYLTALLIEAIDTTVVKGREVMGWMQGCAELLGQENQGIAWTTPLGLKVTQHYQNPAMKQLRTLMGKLYIAQPGKEVTVNRTKQKNSIAPNIIHSFDAAHMMLVALSMPEGTSFAMVHDSYGCHACDLDEMLEVTKETFVDIYQHNWFEVLKSDFMFFSDRQSMPAPPKRGEFDISEVLDSDYFFA